MNSIINKTTIDATTNRRIGGSAPSKYLSKIERDEKIAEDELDAILRSHDIDLLALRRDDFGAFFNARLERLVKQIEDATSKPVNRSASGPESPYGTLESDPEQAVVGIRQVIAAGESKVVEFKSTGRKNLRTGEKDAAMEWSVVKSLAGFMNGHGGTLLVGVADDGSVVGIEEDYPFVSKGDRDGWELWLTSCVQAVLGKVAAADLTTTVAEVDGRTVARIDVGHLRARCSPHRRRGSGSRSSSSGSTTPPRSSVARTRTSSSGSAGPTESQPDEPVNAGRADLTSRLRCDGDEATGRQAVIAVGPSMTRSAFVLRGLQVADAGALHR